MAETVGADLAAVLADGDSDGDERDGNERDRDAPPDPDAKQSVDDAPPDPLLAWALAGFHVALLVVVAVTVLHAVDALGGLLGGLGTVTGLWLYAALWVLTWLTNRRFLRSATLSPTRRSVLTAAMLGGATGVAFLLVLSLTLGVITLNPVLSILLAAIGSPIAAVVGAVVGVAALVVDLLVGAVTRTRVGGT